MKPQIIFINRVYPPVHGATGRVMRDLAQGFVESGWDVRVITSGARAGQERDGKVAVRRVKGAGKPKSVIGYVVVLLRLFFAALALPKIAKGAQDAPIVVTMTDPPMLAVLGWFLQRVKGYRHMHWCQDLYPDLFPVIGVKFPAFLQKAMEQVALRAMRAADKIVVVGRCMAVRLADKGIDKARLSVIPNWPDAELLHDVAGESAGFGDDHFFSDAVRSPDEQVKDKPKFRILYAGNIGRAHPIDTILQAAEVLNKDHPEIEFVFVGDGPEFEKVSQMRALKHLDTIRLLPYQPAHKLRDLMESGDVHLVAMKDEGLGMLVPCKLYSGLAVGRPCVWIGPREGEGGKVIRDYGAGEVVVGNDVRGLIDIIRRYRNEPEAWFAAQKAAAKAGQVFVPGASKHAWIKRAEDVFGKAYFAGAAKRTKRKRAA
ncbi:MAG: glycosyltransferase family 4 protein [Alphaproteobacteria bacterium]